MRTASSDGVDLVYEVRGAGEPLLLVAGTGYPGATWHPDLLEAMAESFTVITFDHRGTGGSQSSDGDYSTEQFADDAAAVLEACTDRPAQVVGHSMGGRVAQWLAIKHPHRVDRLVLAATGAGAAATTDIGRVGVPVSTANGIATDGYREYVRALQRSTFFTDEYVAEDGPMIAWLEQAFWSGRPELPDYLKHVCARQGHSSRSRIHEIDVPTLVLVGELDTHCGGTGSHLEQSEELHRLVAGSELVVLPRVKHGFFWERLDTSVGVLTEWLVGGRP